MSFGAKTKGLFSFHDAAKQASSAGKWRDHVFKLSDSANNWDELWDAIGERSLIEMLLYGINVPETSRLVWVGKDRNCDFSLVSLALAEIASWTGGDVPDVTNPVVIMVKPGTYEDYMELTQNYVHIFGVGNQAESVIIQNNAHHILTVDHPTSGMGFNIIKGLELYQYGADSISNVLFNTTVNPSLTALMCRECYFKRDVAGATTVDSDAMFKVNHGLFFGEDIRAEMTIGTDGGGTTARTPRMFYAGDGAMVGLLLRDAKLDYTTVDEDDINSMFLTHADFTGEIKVDTSEINMVNAASNNGGTYYVLNQLSNTLASFFDTEFSMSLDNAVSPDELTMHHIEAGEVVSKCNAYNFQSRAGGTVFGGTGCSVETYFDYVNNGVFGTGHSMFGIFFDENGLKFRVDWNDPGTKALPADFGAFWFDDSTREFRLRIQRSSSNQYYSKSLSYEDWSHIPEVLNPIVGAETYRLSVPVDYFMEHTLIPGRPIYSVLEYTDTKCHGIITAAAQNGSDWEIDVAGYIPLEAEAHDAQSYRFGDFSRVVVERFTIPGLFAYQADTQLLKNFLGQYFIWRRGSARIVQISHRVVTADSGANQPRVNVSVGGNKVCTSNSTNGRAVSTSWVHTVDDIDGPVNGGNNYNRLTFGSELEITVDANGSNKDAADLTVEIVVILE